MDDIVVIGVVGILALGAYWSLVIFPRQRDFQKQQKYVNSLQPGDEMITYGGLIVKVIDIDETTGVAQVELAEGVTTRMIAAALLRPYDPQELAENIRKSANRGKESNE